MLLSSPFVAFEMAEVIVPEMIGSVVGCYNGKNFINVRAAGLVGGRVYTSVPSAPLGSSKFLSTVVSHKRQTPFA